MHLLDQSDIARVVLSITRSRLAQLRCVSPSSIVWSADLATLDFSDSLEVTSIELLELASEVSEFFHLHETRLDDSLLLRPQFDEWVGLIHSHCEQQAFSFYTSGSTGEPKLCTHTASNLWQEIEFFAATIKYQRLISLVPEHHIYGFLWAILLPKCTGVPVLTGEEAQRVAQSAPRAGDLLVATPPVWDFLLRSWGEVTTGVLGVSSTAPLAPATAARLRHEKLTELYEIYGSSETAAIGYRHGHSGQYELLPYFSALDEANLQKVDEAGQHSILPIQDYLDFVEPLKFVVAGRRDGLVQIAGHNVCLETVASKIAQHQKIDRVDVQSQELGGKQRLIAQVQSVDALSELQQAEIRTWCQGILPPHQSPALRFSTLEGMAAQ